MSSDRLIVQALKLAHNLVPKSTLSTSHRCLHSLTTARGRPFAICPLGVRAWQRHLCRIRVARSRPRVIRSFANSRGGHSANSERTRRAAFERGIGHSSKPPDHIRATPYEAVVGMTGRSHYDRGRSHQSKVCITRCPDYNFLNVPMSSPVEAAEISEVSCWLLRGCHWETASEMILVVAEAIRVRFA